MSDRFKFRAWDEINKKFWYLDYPWNNDWYDTPSGRGRVLANNNQTIEPMYASGNFILEQQLPIYDKSGKPIYEGDILATYNKDDAAGDIWGKKEFGYTIVYWDKRFAGFLGHEWTWTDDTSSVYFLDFIEIIGNIHENPELLEGK
jgi:uncharacterized phage protein (TIGR01671 family)